MGLRDLFRKRRQPTMGSPRANDAVRARLSDYGDDGARVRHVLHYAYPGGGDRDPTTRQGLIDALKERGYAVSDAAVGGGLVLQQYQSVAPEIFDQVTAELSAWFAARGWEYDGWECEVLNGE